MHAWRQGSWTPLAVFLLQIIRHQVKGWRACQWNSAITRFRTGTVPRAFPGAATDYYIIHSGIKSVFDIEIADNIILCALQIGCITN